MNSPAAASPFNFANRNRAKKPWPRDMAPRRFGKLIELPFFRKRPIKPMNRGLAEIERRRSIAPASPRPAPRETLGDQHVADRAAAARDAAQGSPETVALVANRHQRKPSAVQQDEQPLFRGVAEFLLALAMRRIDFRRVDVGDPELDAAKPEGVAVGDAIDADGTSAHRESRLQRVRARFDERAFRRRVQAIEQFQHHAAEHADNERGDDERNDGGEKSRHDEAAAARRLRASCRAAPVEAGTFGKFAGAGHVGKLIISRLLNVSNNRKGGPCAQRSEQNP